MNETKFEPFKKAVAVACVLMACGIMSSMCFAPEQVQMNMMQNLVLISLCLRLNIPLQPHTLRTKLPMKM